MEGLTDMEDVLTVVDVKDIALCGGRRPKDDVEAPKSAATKGAQAAVLPTTFQLFCHLFGEVVWTRRCRLIFSLDLLLHSLAASAVTALLWAHMVVDRLGRYKWKIYFFCCMCILIMLTELVSAYLNGALVLRLAGRTKGGIREALLPIWTRNMLSVLFVAMALGAIRLVFIVANNIIPCSGILILPFVLKWCSVKRKRVALMDQLDMILSICLLENLNQRAAKRRAINYYIETWGENPRRRVRVDLVFALCALVLIFGAGLPCAIVGAKQKNEVLRLSGFTIIIWTVASMQLLRPIAANVYAAAAYLYTEEGRNDIWTRFPALAPQAYVSKEGKGQGVGANGEEAKVAEPPSKKPEGMHKTVSEQTEIENPTVVVN